MFRLLFDSGNVGLLLLEKRISLLCVRLFGNDDVDLLLRQYGVIVITTYMYYCISPVPSLFITSPLVRSFSFIILLFIDKTNLHWISVYPYLSAEFTARNAHAGRRQKEYAPRQCYGWWKRHVHGPYGRHLCDVWSSVNAGCDRSFMPDVWLCYVFWLWASGGADRS